MCARLPTDLLLPLGLLAAAAAARGLAGVLLGFMAVVVVLDRALDRVGGSTATGAEQRFRRLTRHRRGELAYLPLDTGWAAVARRRRLGVQPIAVESIVGTVDGHKAVAFDRDFRPPKWSRGRWTQMCVAAERGASLPPIAVYRVGDEHFVADGHHRVSVARALGAADIDADVVELHPAYS